MYDNTLFLNIWLKSSVTVELFSITWASSHLNNDILAKYWNAIIFYRLEGCLLCSCFIALIHNRLTIFYTYGNYMIWSSAAFLWIWLTIIPDILIFLVLFILLIYVPFKWLDSNRLYALFVLLLALLVLAILSCNILLLIRTGKFP